ncbi:ImmA/IrrE family metallo-endopeptidase [Chryseobacterium oryctis]|uniref:ImmA/IrrE family metallo-endopeptidase n=1 Tax=Chryseobacterium oryctis TaxID=2952618 RepID=A0ABT3HS92_9FLAO|nr:ImmA/IrrE family metallo-endopeptidase [Chryseobacterium oryctis]MCW3162648.1 ImmA/IrrE family metallo-endopeptidase [Chryseobacterium oryctis]
MIDEVTKKDIEKISYELLKSSKSLDIFPTPVDSILNYSDFVADNKIDLLNIEHSFFEKFKDSSIKILQSGISKVKGMFDRREKTIYIDIGLDKNLGKKNFVQLHEIGHGVLGWQNEMMLCLDNDDTLSPEIEEQFEQEANYFASITLFQHDRFIQEAEKLKLGLSSVMALSKKFGASVHATLRNYVLKSKNKCALLVLNHPINENGHTNILTTRDLFYSPLFLQELGELNLPEKFGFKWAFVQDYKFKKRFNDNGSISLVTLNGEELKANYHFFNSTYNSFVFIFPKGEKNKAKTKVILS